MNLSGLPPFAYPLLGTLIEIASFAAGFTENHKNIAETIRVRNKNCSASKFQACCVSRVFERLQEVFDPVSARLFSGTFRWGEHQNGGYVFRRDGICPYPFKVADPHIRPAFRLVQFLSSKKKKPVIEAQTRDFPRSYRDLPPGPTPPAPTQLNPSART